MSRGTPRRTIAARRALAVAALCLVAVVAFLLLREEGFVPADTRGATVRAITVDSEAVGESLETSVVIPAGGGEGRPLLVFLHGRDGDERSFLDYDSVFTALSMLEGQAPVIAFPDGGEASYWHDRNDGDWGTYVLDEVIPEALATSGADPTRVAVGGISMGGYGALHLAAERPERFCAAGGHSPALWEEAGLSAPGAFDDAEDFEENDVLDDAATGSYGTLPIWIDAGEEDPFLPGIEKMSDHLNGSGANYTYEIQPGSHESAYWEQHFPEYLRFYAAELADC